MEAAMTRSLVFYLRCQPGTAAKRSQQGEVRPLLAGVDPVQRMRTLLEERDPFYLLAHHQVQAEQSTPEAVAAEIIALARHHGGW
jgi:shikimate kinase